MSLKLLIDEDSQAKLLVTLLLQAGHNVVTVNSARLSGQTDRIVFDYACKEGRLVLTRNYDDFQALHKMTSNHPGILVVYHDDDYSKNMTHNEITKAIANLETAKISLANQFIALNHWNY